MDEMAVKTFFILFSLCIYSLCLFKLRLDPIVDQLDETLEASRRFREEEGIKLIFED